MNQSETIILGLKLILSGLAAFFAILLWARTKDSAWMTIVAGTVIRYAGTVYDLLCGLNVIIPESFSVFNLPVSTVLFVSIPDLLFIIAFILMLRRSR